MGKAITTISPKKKERKFFFEIKSIGLFWSQNMEEKMRIERTDLS